MPQRTCIVFAKWPEPGRVKTRLAAGCSTDLACKFYRICCEHVVIEAQREQEWDCFVAIQPNDSEAKFRGWLGDRSGMKYVKQLPDPDLGARMHHAITSALDAGSEKAILVGSDIPDISTKLLSAAFAALDHAQVVLGPAADGGYWLIGASALPAEALQGIEWSTDSVLQATLDRAQAAGLSVDSTSLPTLRDIDTFQDLETWLETASASHPLKAGTQQLMRQLGEEQGGLPAEAPQMREHSRQ